jgi:Ca2+-binding RTX toxin-like protein
VKIAYPLVPEMMVQYPVTSNTPGVAVVTIFTSARSSKPDRLRGQRDDDELEGNRGDDHLTGGGGFDIGFGGVGSDTCTGVDFSVSCA